MKALSEIVATVVLLSVALGIAGAIYAFIGGVSAAKTVTVEEVTSYCVNNTAYFVVRNGGDKPLTASSFVCTKIDSGCAGNCVIDKIFPAGGAGYIKIDNCSSGAHTFSLTGSTNGLQLVVYCQ